MRIVKGERLTHGGEGRCESGGEGRGEGGGGHGGCRAVGGDNDDPPPGNDKSSTAHACSACVRIRMRGRSH